MLTKTTIKYHYPPTWMANKRSESPGENEEQPECSVIAADGSNLYKLFEKLFGSTYKN